MKHFLQSREWEEFQKSIGRETRRIEGLLITKLPLIFNKNYLYCAGAWIGGEKLKEIAKLENAVFLKVEPMVQGESMEGLIFPRGGPDLPHNGFRKSFKQFQPQRTVVLDITKSEGELLGGMRAKARYNARLASKQGLEFRILNFEFRNKSEIQNSKQKNYLEDFWALIKKTAERDAFHTHSNDYYQKLLEMPLTKLFGVEYNGKLIAASIVLFYDKNAYYLHGASDYEHRNLMAPYLLHWETIKYAKEKGFKSYDFWGIDKKKWSGVTRFKRGFGGREVEYIGSYDYVFLPFMYYLYKGAGFYNGARNMAFKKLRSFKHSLVN